MGHTFTFTTSAGKAFDVEPDFEVDNWTGRELRAIERLNGGTLGSGTYSTTCSVFAVAIARQVPGYTVESADAELTLGKVRAALAELRAKERAALEAEAPAGEPAEGDVVLSPTRPGDEQPGDTPDQ